MLKERIERDFITAYKAKDNLKKDALGMIKSKIVELSKTSTEKIITDSDVLGVINSEIKKRESTLDLIKDQETSSAIILRENTLKELGFIKAYLPTQLSVEEINKIISTFIVDVDTKNFARLFGPIMKEFSTNYKGQYDGKKLKDIIDQYLK